MSETEEIENVVSPTSLIVGPPAHAKLSSWDLYRALGAPKHVVAPMVDQSELAWRILSRLHGADLVYTPMIHAALFASDDHPSYLRNQFDLAMGEEGKAGLDRPLSAQFCANDPELFLKAAMRLAEPGACDAVDLNLGCPQGIAKRGHYGAFLFEDWALIEKLIHHLHVNLPIPITAKFRVTDDVETSVKYAQMLERAGAQILCCHGRTREQKGHHAGLADWKKIAAIKKAVSVPVFANGNILVAEDVTRCLEETGCEAVMSAEGNLANPALFAPLTTRDKLQATLDGMPAFIREALGPLLSSVDALADGNPPIVDTARRYLAIVKALGTRTATSAVKAHLFKLLRPLWAPESAAGPEFHDVRDKLSAVGIVGEWADRIEDYCKLVDELAVRLQDDRHREPEHLEFPHYTRIQACVRPSASEASTSKRPLSPSAAVNEDAKRSRQAGDDDANSGKENPVCAKCKYNRAALSCSTSSCWTCCPAGDACETHERKAAKQAERAALKAAKKADRKAKRGKPKA